MKQWVAEEAARSHRCWFAIYDRLVRSKHKKVWYPGVTVRRVNKRLAFVTDNRPEAMA